MRRRFAPLIVGFAIGVVSTWALIPGSAPPAEVAAGQAEVEVAEDLGAGDSRLLLDPAAVERAGLRTSALAAGELPPEHLGYGAVLDPTPLASALFGSAAAQAALEASGQEYERTRSLHEQDENASQRELDNARAVFRRDAIALEAARSLLVSSWGEALAASEELPHLVHELVARDAALVRINLPLGERIDGLPSAARVAPVAATDAALPARVLGPAPTTDPTLQGQGFLLLVEDRALAPGTALVGWLTRPGPARSGVVVPRAALLRRGGEVFVYVQSGPGSFERRAVELESPLAEGWFVGGGVSTGEQVVVAGSQQLLSEELRKHFEQD